MISIKEHNMPRELHNKECFINKLWQPLRFISKPYN